jgi:PAS domain S-box-containing protein
MSFKRKSPVEAPELRVLADIAARLASGIGSEDVLSGVAETLYRDLDLVDCRIWVRSRAGDRFRPIVPAGRPPAGDDAAVEVARWLGDAAARTKPPLGERHIRIPLVTDGPPLGLLEALFREAGRDRDRHTLTIVANALALWVASTELSEDLASEVAYRTREIDAHRRFTTRIIDSLPVGLYVIDHEYLIQEWNRKRETGTQGISRDEAIGRPVFDVLKRQPRALLKDEFDKVFRTGRMEQMDMESTASGELRFYRISKIPSPT